ncbi:hypothetical protein PspS34_14500 [Pseudomonas sp. S34]|nr:hypothetical protein PspS34_14500 [Pseudomonas sp. S34]
MWPTPGRSFISLATALPVLCMGLLAPLAPRLALRWGLEPAIALCYRSMSCSEPPQPIRA